MMPKRHTEQVMHSSARSDWRTPPRLFAVLDREFHFHTDVAATRDTRLCAGYYGPDHHEEGFRDALLCGWGVRRTCFMNPPYDLKHPIGPWIKKAWRESYVGATVIGVLPFSPQTEWYRDYIYGHSGFLDLFHAAAEERRLSHRVTFLRPDGTPADNAPGNTVIIVWRPNPGYVGPWQPAVRYWSYR